MLRKIKSEYITRKKISNDIFIDAQAAKIMTDILCKPNKQLPGLNPFGFILISEIQVKNCLFFAVLESFYLNEMCSCCRY